MSEILSSGGAGAEKIRDFLGQALTISDYAEVKTRLGNSIQLVCTTDDGADHMIWAPSVVARQVLELGEEGYLPVRLTVGEVQSQNGRAYYTLVDAHEEEPYSSGPPIEE